jgi:hypothetical protein
MSPLNEDVRVPRKAVDMKLRLKLQKKPQSRPAGDTQRIADWTLSYHPDYSNSSKPDTLPSAETIDSPEVTPCLEGGSGFGTQAPAVVAPNLSSLTSNA